MTHNDDRPLEGRVYPAGTPVRRGPVMLPAHAPRPGDIPPWHHNPPPPPPAPEPDDADDQDDAPHDDSPDEPVGGAPTTRTILLPGSLDDEYDRDDAEWADARRWRRLPRDPERDGPAWWERALDRIRPWHTLVGAALALVPTPTGYSAAATWASTVWYGHEEALWLGYALAAVGVLAAYRAERRAGDGMVRGLLVRTWTVCALIGITGTLDLWDPVQIWTGVPL